MQFVPSGIPNNCDVLGVLGYLIVVNKQVHSYQVDALTEYLEHVRLNINETVLNDIIEGKDASVSFTTLLAAFSGEPKNIQKDIYYMLGWHPQNICGAGRTKVLVSLRLSPHRGMPLLLWQYLRLKNLLWLQPHSVCRGQ